ncbi:MAG TPA: circadian clock protein KaiC [Lacibacter sp.]|nr:circadian clock protein KaiC [Lacibacter sp.]
MAKNSNNQFPKTPTGINGLDEITNGGLPKGRPTLMCGSPGCGKTIFGVEFLVNGITQFNEPGVFMSFEETAKDLILNMGSLGFDLDKLIEQKKLRIDHVRVERSEIEETGEYDLEGLFIRLNHAIDSIGAKRVVLDTLETLFGGIDNTAILRSEIRRLFHWLKEKGVTVIITGERGDNTLTRQGLEEYVSDCVILLDFRVINQLATRRLRIVKYRGSTHGTNEYPFLIDETGVSVIPITSLKLDHKVSTNIISTGVSQLDELFARGGIFKGSSLLLTGSAGTAKTILASSFALESCKRGDRTLYFSFEESQEQLIRNMSSVGINLRPYIKSKMLFVHSSRPSLTGLERHLLVLHNLIDEFQPRTVIIDPISSLLTVGSISEVKDILIRVIDILKTRQINAFFCSLTQANKISEDITVDAVSSLADIWIDTSFDALNSKEGVRNLRIIKNRGMGHEMETQQFRVTGKGLKFTNSKKIA